MQRRGLGGVVSALPPIALKVSDLPGPLSPQGGRGSQAWAAFDKPSGNLNLKRLLLSWL